MYDYFTDYDSYTSSIGDLSSSLSYSSDFGDLFGTSEYSSDSLFGTSEYSSDSLFGTSEYSSDSLFGTSNYSSNSDNDLFGASDYSADFGNLPSSLDNMFNKSVDIFGTSNDSFNNSSCSITSEVSNTNYSDISNNVPNATDSHSSKKDTNLFTKVTNLASTINKALEPPKRKELKADFYDNYGMYRGGASTVGNTFKADGGPWGYVDSFGNRYDEYGNYQGYTIEAFPNSGIYLHKNLDGNIVAKTHPNGVTEDNDGIFMGTMVFLDDNGKPISPPY